MNLLEAKELFNKIVDDCPTLEGVHFMIAPSIAVHTVVDGYEIHLSGKKIDNKIVVYLRNLAAEKGLFMDSKETAVGIYKLKKGSFT